MGEAGRVRESVHLLIYSSNGRNSYYGARQKLGTATQPGLTSTWMTPDWIPGFLSRSLGWKQKRIQTQTPIRDVLDTGA